MNFQEYTIKMKDIQSKLLEFLDNEENIEENYENLVKLIQVQDNNLHELKLILYLIATISNNHHRSAKFFDKIEQILLLLKNHIKKIFTNFEIFNIFQDNKKILLFLIQNDILSMDQEIIKILTENHQYRFFIPEIKKFIDDEKNSFSEINTEKINHLFGQISEDYYEKRNIGENENYINELIRKDNIENFIILINKENIRLDSSVIPSIYETNSFLLNKASLIEYAAFFGSIQIFKYLYLNGVNLTFSLWMYGIHGDCPELIHILEENKIEARNNDYERLLEEAIKCHHNDMANYIRDNHINNENNPMNDEFFYDINDKCFTDNILSYAFHYYNFEYISVENANFFTFYYACRYDYYTLVDFFLKTRKMYLQETILNLFCFK